MTKKTKIIAIISWIALILLCEALLRTGTFWQNAFSEGAPMHYPLLWTELALLVFGAVGGVITLFVLRVNIANKVGQFLLDKDYEGGVKYFESKLKNYIAYGFIVSARYFILVFSLALNDIGRVREEINRGKWGATEIFIKYPLILLSLKDGDLESARNDYKKLKVKPKKKLAAQLDTLDRAFNCIESGDFSDKFYENSIFPIVKEIYDEYKQRAGAPSLSS